MDAVHLPEWQLGKAMGSSSLLQLAGTFLPFHGYQDVEAYFRENDPEPVLQHIECPLLVLAAKDDPLVLPVPREAIRRNRRIILAETEGGGHLGWAGWSSIGLGATMVGPSWADSAATRVLAFHTPC